MLGVRVPSGVPRRSKVRFASTFFMQKTSSARSLASPSQIESTALGFDLVKGANLKALASIVLGYSKNRQVPCGTCRFLLVYDSLGMMTVATPLQDNTKAFALKQLRGKKWTFPFM